MLRAKQMQTCTEEWEAGRAGLCKWLIPSLPCQTQQAWRHRKDELLVTVLVGNPGVLVQCPELPIIPPVGKSLCSPLVKRGNFLGQPICLNCQLLGQGL